MPGAVFLLWARDYDGGARQLVGVYANIEPLKFALHNTDWDVPPGAPGPDIEVWELRAGFAQRPSRMLQTIVYQSVTLAEDEPEEVEAGP